MEKNDRFWFIELCVFWEQCLSTTNIIRKFGITRQQASKIINLYKEQFPQNLCYSAAQKSYSVSDSFAPGYITADAHEYLSYLSTCGLIPSQAVSGDSLMRNETLALPTRRVPPKVLRTLVKAIQTRQRVEVDYVSLSNPNREGRVIAPHTFVNTGLRWHLRAYCEKSTGYRDFVLSRFVGDAELSGLSDHTQHRDMSWQTEVSIEIAPDPRLSPEQQQILVDEYAMIEGKLTILTRAALVQYLIQQMQINVKKPHKDPLAQQLVVLNKKSIAPWLF